MYADWMLQTIGDWSNPRSQEYIWWAQTRPKPRFIGHSRLFSGSRKAHSKQSRGGGAFCLFPPTGSREILRSQHRIALGREPPPACQEFKLFQWKDSSARGEKPLGKETWLFVFLPIRRVVHEKKRPHHSHRRPRT